MRFTTLKMFIYTVKASLLHSKKGQFPHHFGPKTKTTEENKNIIIKTCNLLHLKHHNE